MRPVARPASGGPRGAEGAGLDQHDPETHEAPEAAKPWEIVLPEEGATEHIGLDHLPHVSTFIADWVADTFAEPATRAG